jgi:hypothetical protein
MANNHTELERRLWGAGDDLRANSKLKSAGYSIPVLGLIFLRYANHKFAEAEKKLAQSGSGRRKLGKTDYQAQGVLYLPEKARFAYPTTWLAECPEASTTPLWVAEAKRYQTTCISKAERKLKMIRMKEKVAGLLVMALALVVAIPAWGQQGATLRVTTDLDCNWKLDDTPQGLLKAGDAKVVPVSLGKHLVQATSTDGRDEWGTVVTVSQAGQEKVAIQLKAAHQQHPAEADWQQHPTWTDPATGLMWTRQDNGSNVDWNQANNYCQNLTLGGYSHWRLPTIEELAAIYDLTQTVNGWHIKGGIRLTKCCSWSSSAGRASGEAWAFGFYIGERLSHVRGYSDVLRALCVRRSRK